MPPLAVLAGLLVAGLQTAPAPTAAPSPTPTPAPPTGPRVVLETSLGSITIGLDAEHAPKTVDNFLGYVRSGHYEGTVFHRVIANFMIQGGGLTPDLQEKPAGGPIRSEARNGLRNMRGSLAMARTSDPHSARAQFFINVRDNHLLDFGIGGAGYTVFGRVLEGMDVVDRIAAVPTGNRGTFQDVPYEPVFIVKASVSPTEAGETEGTGKEVP